MLKRFALVAALASVAFGPPPASAAGPHDFDFEFGSWHAVLRARPPLSRSDRWTVFRGISTVRTIWGGRANLGELSLVGPHGRLDGLSLRLFDPHARVWKLYFADAATGKLGVADVGGFENGRGLFYDHETYDGKPVIVRFSFSPVVARAFTFTQAYSADGGKTWLDNWVANFKR